MHIVAIGTGHFWPKSLFLPKMIIDISIHCPLKRLINLRHLNAVFIQNPRMSDDLQCCRAKTSYVPCICNCCRCEVHTRFWPDTIDMSNHYVTTHHHTHVGPCTAHIGVDNSRLKGNSRPKLAGLVMHWQSLDANGPREHPH